MKYRVDYTRKHDSITGCVIVEAQNAESAFSIAESKLDGMAIQPQIATRMLTEELEWNEAIHVLATMPQGEFEELLDRVYSQQWAARMSSVAKA